MKQRLYVALLVGTIMAGSHLLRTAGIELQWWGELVIAMIAGVVLMYATGFNRTMLAERKSKQPPSQP